MMKIEDVGLRIEDRGSRIADRTSKDEGRGSLSDGLGFVYIAGLPSMELRILEIRSFILDPPSSFFRVFLEISLELMAVAFFLAQDIDGQFLRHIIFAICLLD